MQELVFPMPTCRVSTFVCRGPTTMGRPWKFTLTTKHLRNPSPLRIDSGLGIWPFRFQTYLPISSAFSRTEARPAVPSHPTWCLEKAPSHSFMPPIRKAISSNYSRGPHRQLDPSFNPNVASVSHFLHDPFGITVSPRQAIRISDDDSPSVKADSWFSDVARSHLCSGFHRCCGISQSREFLPGPGSPFVGTTRISLCTRLDLALFAYG